MDNGKIENRISRSETGRHENHGQKPTQDSFRLRSMILDSDSTQLIDLMILSIPSIRRVHNEGCAGGRATVYLRSPVVRMFGMAIDVQPQKTANTAGANANARIGGTIVEIDGIAIGCHGIAAR